jgi:hypothetical protein
MSRLLHDFRVTALAAGAWLGVCVVACQGPDPFYRGDDGGLPGSNFEGTGGNLGTGAGGAAVTGAAGSAVSGVAGSPLSGAAGSSATGAAGRATGGSGPAGRGGSTGAAGTTGAAGMTGAAGAGRGGSTGAAGGPAGATGSAGAPGRGGSTGTTGVAGRGGSTGATGRGGATGTAGTTGTAGSTGANMCPAGGRLDCTAAGVLALSTNGQIVDFSAAQWNDTTSRWCDALGLDGGLSTFAGGTSTAMADVDTTAQNLKLNLKVVAGSYAGGRLNFDSCVDATAFNSIQFTASVSAGSLNGCTWQVQLQTQNQRPTTSMPMGGTCNAATTTCERYPVATLMAATAMATTYTVRFTAFNNPSMSTVPTASQIVGLQWQANSNNSGTCTVELRLDNVRFVTQ